MFIRGDRDQDRLNKADPHLPDKTGRHRDLDTDNNPLDPASLPLYLYI